MKTVYYLPFNFTARDLTRPAALTEIQSALSKFKESFLADQLNVTVIPSFNGKEGFELLPLDN